MANTAVTDESSQILVCNAMKEIISQTESVFKNVCF